MLAAPNEQNRPLFAALGAASIAVTRPPVLVPEITSK
jgi:hypothetical protein